MSHSQYCQTALWRTDEGSEAQRGQVICPSTHSRPFNCAQCSHARHGIPLLPQLIYSSPKLECDVVSSFCRHEHAMWLPQAHTGRRWRAGMWPSVCVTMKPRPVQLPFSIKYRISPLGSTSGGPQGLTPCFLVSAMTLNPFLLLPTWNFNTTARRYLVYVL